MMSEELRTSLSLEAAEFIVTNVADDYDTTFISKKILEIVLKPLLEDFISSAMKRAFKFKQEWFTQDHNRKQLLKELAEYFKKIEFFAPEMFKGLLGQKAYDFK